MYKRQVLHRPIGVAGRRSWQRGRRWRGTPGNEARDHQARDHQARDHQARDQRDANTGDDNHDASIGRLEWLVNPGVTGGAGKAAATEHCLYLIQI